MECLIHCKKQLAFQNVTNDSKICHRLKEKGKSDLHSRSKVEVRHQTSYEAILHASGIGRQQTKAGVPVQRGRGAEVAGGEGSGHRLGLGHLLG